MPQNVLSSGLVSYINGFNKTLLAQAQVNDIEARLREVKGKGGLTKADHLASLNQRHGSMDVCLKCGGRMVAPTAKASGRHFLGCSNFPKCRHTIWPKG